LAEFCWSLGDPIKSGPDLLSLINYVASKGLNCRISVVWPPLDLLFAEGHIMGYRGDLSSFSLPKKLEINVYELTDEEILVELEDKDYIKLDSIESLISLIKEIVVREALVIKGKVYPVAQLIDPSSVSVDTETWESVSVTVEEPKEFLGTLISGGHKAINVVSLTERWTLDVLACDDKILGASLYMPESVETIKGSDAFVFPLESPGKWIVTMAKPFLCPKVSLVLDPRLDERLKGVETGVVKL